MAGMGKGTIAIGVSTPGVYSIDRTRHRKARPQPEWLALCVAEQNGTKLHVVKGGHTGGKVLSTLGAGHHHIQCFVAVWPLPAAVDSHRCTQRLTPTACVRHRIRARTMCSQEAATAR